MSVSLSIIMPAHNEESLLPRTLSAARAAAEALGRPFEIIIVNDASTDRTGDVARELGARVVDVDRRQIAAVRNEGAAVAAGEWFVFVDADTEVTPAALTAARDAIRAGAVGGGAGVRFDGFVPLYARCAIALMVPLFRLTRNAAGCFMYATREAFESIGGFDEALFASEEIAFSKSMKRLGRFVVLREQVTTSGRKVRQYSPWYLLRVIARQAVRGPRGAWRSREGLDIWYDAPREQSEE